jgi:hypothetical protein
MKVMHQSLGITIKDEQSRIAGMTVLDQPFTNDFQSEKSPQSYHADPMDSGWQG